MQDLKAVAMGAVASIEYFWSNMANPAILGGDVTTAPQWPPEALASVNYRRATQNPMWTIFVSCGPFCVEQAQKIIGGSELNPSH
jgi:hypothetical protein